MSRVDAGHLYGSLYALGRALEEERLRRGLELHELAGNAHVPPTIVRDVELGLGRPRFHHVDSIVRALELELTMSTAGFRLERVPA